MKTLLFLVVLAVIGGVVYYGYLGQKGKTEQNPITNQAAQQTQKQIENTAQSAWDKTKEAAGKMGDSLKKASGQVEETAKIKAPLSASSDIDTSNLGVETIDKTVYLQGSVPTQEMKDKVDKMARANADKGYTVVDNLTVAAKADDSTPKQGEPARPPAPGK